jgi:hypothetical protein
VRANAALALRGKKAILERLRDRDDSPLVRDAATRALASGGHAPAPGRDWIAAHLVDFDGVALADAAYWLVLPDGLIKSGFADGRGNAREESIPAGACRIELPDGGARR